MIDDLMAHLVGVNPGALGGKYLRDEFYEKYDIEFEQFDVLVSDLIKLIEVTKSEVTGKVYRGFARESDDSQMEWLVKEEVKNEN